MTRGIYTIRCIPTDKVYVGSSIKIESRWRSHISLLKKNEHHSKKLQSEFNQYGLNAFSFTIVEELLDGDLFDAEYTWVKQLDSCETGLNIKDSEGGPGRTTISPLGDVKRCNVTFTPESLTDLEWLLNRGYASKSEAVRVALHTLVTRLKESDNYI